MIRIVSYIVFKVTMFLNFLGVYCRGLENITETFIFITISDDGNKNILGHPLMNDI